MSEDNFTYLFIDKYDGDHTYSNKKTIGINIPYLFQSDMKQIQGKQAIDEYNEFSGVHKFEYFDEETYIVYMFINECQKYTVLGVNNQKILKYIIEKNIEMIPNYSSLLMIVRFHICYTNASLSNGTLIGGQIINKSENIIFETIKHVMSKTGDIIDPIIDNPDFLNVQLFPYQKRSIKWMYDKERNMKQLSFNMNQEVSFGDFYYDVMKQQFLLNDQRKSIKFRGGALCEEVGLGKTIEMLTLSLLNQSKNTSYYEKESNYLHSRATLIICPNQLCGQWKREFDKMVKKDYELKVISILTKVHFDKYTYQELLDADFVIVSLSFLDNNAFIQKTLKKFVETCKTYHRNKPELFNMTAIKLSLEEMGKQLILDPETLFQDNAVLPLIKWHRIIVDEFHEIYTVPKYQYMKNLLPLFTATYKWCVTGTPFDKDTTCINKMIDFVCDYTNQHGDKLFCNKTIEEYVKNHFFRRNTKKSVNSEYQLPPLKEQIVWLKFSPTERMMYNASLANSNVDKYSVLIRQICCDPKLAEETKEILQNCKTLEDIEKELIKYYQNTMNISKHKYDYGVLRYKLTKIRLEKAIKRQWKYILNQLDYLVEIEDNGEEEQIMKEITKLSKYSDDDIINEDNEQNEQIEKKENIKKGQIKIIIGYDNHDEIKQIIKNKQSTYGQQQISNYTNFLMIQQQKKEKLLKDYEGKKSTYEFFTNVVSKIRNKTNKEKEGGDEEDEDVCTICLGEIPENDIGVTKCGHMYCYGCVKSFISKKHECPLCKAKVADDQIYIISYVKEKENNKEIKGKQDLINQVGTKIANLIYFLKNTDKHTILFSQWDDLLRRVGDYLELYGIKTAYCKGNVWQRDKAIRQFNSDDSYKVIMLSSESAASGTNLTKAQQVILLDPVSGSYEYRRNTEWQAIGRAHRMGQLNQVSVVRFIIKDTVEEEIYKENIIEDAKHKQLFKIFETDDDAIVLNKDKIISKIDNPKKTSKKVKQITQKFNKVQIVDDYDTYDSDDSDDSD